MELNKLIEENILNLVYYLLNAYINRWCLFETNKNGLIYILTHMEVKKNKILFLFYFYFFYC